MNEIDLHEVILASEENYDPAEVIIKQNELYDSREDITAKDDFPMGLEDLLYESWRENQIKMEFEKLSKETKEYIGKN